MNLMSQATAEGAARRVEGAAVAIGTIITTVINEDLSQRMGLGPDF